MSDHELLRMFVAEGSASAFGDLVSRHLPLVLSAARRQLAAPHLAEDVAQRVFTLLAAKAGGLNPGVILSGWLYRTTCRMAADTNRTEHRRQRREQEALSMMPDPAADETWRAIAPLLDEAMGTLAERDRDAVVLRYFENKSLNQVGEALGATGDAAQKRLSRAVERLRGFFARRGHALGAGALTAAIGVGAIQSTPSALAASIAAGALTGAAGVSGGGFALFAMTHLKSIFLGGVAVAAAAGLIVQQQQVSRLQNDNALLRARAAEAVTPAVAIPAAASTTPAVDPELLRLRGEVARLQGQHAEVTRLKTELARLKAAANPPPAATQSAGQDAQAMKRQAEAKLIYAKGWALAMHLYAGDNNGQLPRNFEDAAKYLPADAAKTGDLAADQYELMLQGPLAEVKDPAKTILLREKLEYSIQLPDGMARAYAFVDGHSEIHKAESGDFGPWEQERLNRPAGLAGGVGN